MHLLSATSTCKFSDQFFWDWIELFQNVLFQVQNKNDASPIQSKSVNIDKINDRFRIKQLRKQNYIG
jgi:hypothetical protein